jgi:hypothetical protein
MLKQICALMGACAASGAMAASDDVFTLGAGADYTTGKYGSSQSTDILYVPFIAKYETGPWVLKATVPWIRITGPGNVVGAGADRVVLSDGNAPRRTASGLGDIVLSGFYTVLGDMSLLGDKSNARSDAPIGLDLGAKVKLGTADENQGLGTGKNDYSLQADAYKTFGAWTGFGSLGYRWYGDPAGVDLKNVFYGSLGTTYRFSRDASAGVAYDYRPKISPNGGTISEATLFATVRVSRDVKLQPYAILGFSTGSPDYGAGLLAYLSF